MNAVDQSQNDQPRALRGRAAAIPPKLDKTVKGTKFVQAENLGGQTQLFISVDDGEPVNVAQHIKNVHIRMDKNGKVLGLLIYGQANPEIQGDRVSIMGMPDAPILPEFRDAIRDQLLAEEERAKARREAVLQALGD